MGSCVTDEPGKYMYPGQLQTSQLVQNHGKTNREAFLSGKAGEHLLKYPISLDEKGFFEKVSNFTLAQKSNEIRFGTMEYIPDAPRSKDWGYWRGSISNDWKMKPTTVMKTTDLTINILK